ncbi:hypothetical protein ACKTOS_11455, partial [Paenibacillus sp. KR2-11]
HVRIRTFYGTSEQAVMNQIWIALISYCLLVLMKQEVQSSHPLLQLSRWLKMLLWKPYKRWVGRVKLRPTRSSAGRQSKKAASCANNQ